ncbi:hypothetical protein [Candidatus Nitrosotalea okcheonensis]|uniref:Roadblock/LAMTOR2 domain-containing protein n=1 Tax=Candidatus Nitrosotalea okcheonensis TaxID=1903276 RepID=A0A2H1FEN1_9ARCH|nr:hypothetical protein [Candidatus Nitrosotalea okcheonensis]SMH71109.1 protein of unknown function [Candidatus Nitrosotalea okcheonensis]
MNTTKTVKFDQICKSMLNIDRNVRSVAIMDRNGRLIHSETHRGFTQPSFDKWNNVHYMECTFDISLGAKFDDLYGPIRYHHSGHDDFMMFSFPYHKNIIIVTSTKKVSPIAFATKISKFINGVTV